MGKQWFAIVLIADGSLVSHETDDCQQRATDAELLAKGMQRIAIADQIKIDQQWNKVTKQAEVKAGYSVTDRLS